MVILNRCQHEWRIENRQAFPAAWELMSESERERVQPEPWMFCQKAVALYMCRHCSETKRVVDYSLDERE